MQRDLTHGLDRPSTSPVLVGLASLGCAKNLVDSEVMLGLLRKAGYEITPDASAATVIIVNTCGFIESAKQESIDTALEMAGFKANGVARALILTGCLAQRYARQLLEELPEVDAVVGVGDYHRITDIVRRVLAGERVLAVGAPGPADVEGLDRVATGPAHSVYLKIAEGCNHRCAFCAIPAIRGRYHSRPLEGLLREAEGLARQGAGELVLIAQDTSAYGKDLYGEPRLPALLTSLAGIDTVAWLRVLYCYPGNITRRLIEVLSTEPKVCKYLDIPLQHASDRLLRTMRRSGNAGTYARLIKRLRDDVPEIALRSTFIVGLPGETEEDFTRLLDFVAESRFDHVGCFTYSPEEGTAGARMSPQIPAELALERRARLMELQQSIALDINRARVGRTETILSEGATAHASPGGQHCQGRSYREAPEIDGLVLMDRRVESGRFCRVRITKAQPYDVEAHVEAVLG